MMSETKVTETPMYYVPEQSGWPITGSIGLFTMVVGGVNLLHEHTWGLIPFLAGALIIAYMMFGWFGTVIRESHAGLYSKMMDRSFRWGMVWFIFSEVMFFAAFFGVLFYVRHLATPWLAGLGAKPMTGKLLWPHFQAAWPLLHNPDSKLFVPPKAVVHAWGVPALNTIILLTSGVTVTWAHWGLKTQRRGHLIVGLLVTVILGIAFIGFQATEYHHAYTELGLTLGSGIYGTTFFMLTGFHGAHVTIGAIMLAVMLFRSLKGHFTPEHHFAFEAASWYWHFVDVVWLGLFIFVYWL
jgi:cytochrome c oxidase subunit III